MASLKEVDSRLTALETKEDERWRETILRIKRIESLMIGAVAAIIGMLSTFVFKG